MSQWINYGKSVYIREDPAHNLFRYINLAQSKQMSLEKILALRIVNQLE